MTMPNTSAYPLVKLPQAIDEILYMIREDLKSQKYFDGQAALNGTDSPYRPHLAKLILRNMNLDDGSDEIFQFYFRLIEKRSKRIGEDNTSTMKQVMKVHAALLMEKGRRNGSTLIDGTV
jgi:hypothetical protein